MTSIWQKPSAENQPLVWCQVMTQLPQVPISQLSGVWQSVSQNQLWQQLELFQTGFLLIGLKSGHTISGNLKFYANGKCSLCVYSQNQSINIQGSWCFWEGVLDFCFLGEFLIFTK